MTEIIVLFACFCRFKPENRPYMRHFDRTRKFAQKTNNTSLDKKYAPQMRSVNFGLFLELRAFVLTFLFRDNPFGLKVAVFVVTIREDGAHSIDDTVAIACVHCVET